MNVGEEGMSMYCEILLEHMQTPSLEWGIFGGLITTAVSFLSAEFELSFLSS